MDRVEIPPPGSDAARDLGCTCPVLDNARGRGWMGGVTDEDGGTVYVYNLDCPLHGEVAGHAGDAPAPAPAPPSPDQDPLLSGPEGRQVRDEDHAPSGPALITGGAYAGEGEVTGRCAFEWGATSPRNDGSGCAVERIRCWREAGHPGRHLGPLGQRPPA